MCGRYARFGNRKVYLDEFVIKTTAKEVADLFERPRYNIAPTQEVIVVRDSEAGRELMAMRWGLLPSWTKDLKKAPLLNNARAESVAEKPSFRAAFKSRRCIIPADGFFEWHTEGKQKLPWYIHRVDERPLAMAGLWETWQDTTSCCIVTTEANELMTPIHERMPVILAAVDYDAWLNPTVQDVGHMLAPCPSDELAAYRVDQAVNNWRHEAPDCVEPLGPQP